MSKRTRMLAAALVVAGLFGGLVHDWCKDPLHSALSRTLDAALSGHPYTLALRRERNATGVVVGVYRGDYERIPDVRVLAENLLTPSRGERLQVLTLGDPPPAVPWALLALPLGLGYLAGRRRWPQQLWRRLRPVAVRPCRPAPERVVIDVGSQAVMHELASQVPILREQVTERTGWRLPAVRVRLEPGLQTEEWVLCLRGRAAAHGGTLTTARLERELIRHAWSLFTLEDATELHQQLPSPQRQQVEVYDLFLTMRHMLKLGRPVHDLSGVARGIVQHKAEYGVGVELAAVIGNELSR